MGAAMHSHAQPLDEQDREEAQGRQQGPLEDHQPEALVPGIAGEGIQREQHRRSQQQQQDQGPGEDHAYQARTGCAKPAGASRSLPKLTTSKASWSASNARISRLFSAWPERKAP